MGPQIAVALYDRGAWSRGHQRKVQGYMAYHWALVTAPQIDKDRECKVFDVSDSTITYPGGKRPTNPSMDWYFRAKSKVRPGQSSKLLGMLIIGNVKDGVSDAELEAFLAQVPLPLRNQVEQQSCVTWTIEALDKLQTKEWIEKFNTDTFKNCALAYADERMKGDSKEPEVKVYES